MAQGLREVVQVSPIEGYRLSLVFDDGVSGIVDLSSLAGHGIFEQWNDPEVFAAVHIGSGGEVCWNESLDLCPDALYLQLTGTHTSDAIRTAAEQCHAGD